jgi:hypothetical protein
MVIFRENTEDIYAGIEWEAESPEAKKVIDFLENEMKVKKIRFPATSGIGIKPVSREGSQRLIRAAIEYALKFKRKSVNIVHKGNIMKFTEGAFKDWGYELAVSEFRGKCVTERESWILGNKEANPDLSVEDNAKQIEPGYDMAPADAQKEFRDEVEAALKLWDTHGRASGRRCSASRTRSRTSRSSRSDPPEGVRGHRHAEPQRRLPLRRARGPGRRHRHRPGGNINYVTATPSSRPPTAPRRSTRTSTR